VKSDAIYTAEDWYNCDETILEYGKILKIIISKERNISRTNLTLGKLLTNLYELNQATKMIYKIQ